MPAPSLFDQLREQSRPSFEPEPLDTGRIVKDVDTRLAKESADYAKGQEQAAKDAAKQQVQGLREKGYTVVHDEAGNPAPLTATNGEPVRRKAGSRIHVGEQTGTYYEPDLQKGGLKPAVGQKKTDKNGRIIEDFGGGLIKDLGEDPAWAKRKEDKTLLTKAEAAIRDKMLAPPPEGMDVVKTKKDYATAQKALAKAENNLESEPTDKDYLAAHAKAKADLDAIAPQNEAVNQWSKSKTGLRGQLAQINTHRKLLGEGAFTDEHRKQWQGVIAPPAAPQPASVTPPAPTAGSSGQAALQASQQPMSESPTAAPTAPVAVQPQNIPPIAAPAPVVAAPQPNAVAAPVTPAPREQPVTPEAVADLPIDAHSSAIQASDAALKQNAAAIQQKQDAINAPVAAVDAKLSAWQAKSQAALATGDAAISMMQLDGTMSPLFAASTKKELQDLYSERQEAEKKVASQLEELNGAWVAHQEDVDAHNQAVESLKGKITAQENERRSSIEKMREQPALAPYADKINALDKETAENNAKIDSASWDENAKEAARAGLKASHEAKLKDIQKGIEETVNPVVRLQKEQDFAEEYRQMKDTLDTGDVRGTDPKQVAKLKADLASKFNVSPDDFDKLANAAESRPYSVEDGKIKFAPANFDDAVTPDVTLKGFEQAVKDGVIDPKSAPEARAELQKANEEYQKLVAEAGGADKVKAALVGAGKGAAFMAGAELVGPVGAELGAKAGVLVGPEGVPIGATIGSIVGALLGGVTAGAAYDKIRETAGEYFKAVNSFNAAAKLNPGVTQASELASFVVMPEGLLKPSLFAKEGLKAGLTPAVAKSVEGYAKLADIAADAVGEAGASAAIDSARNVAKLKEVLKAGTGSVGGAVAFTAGQYAFDAGRYAIADLVGIKHDELHAPTFGDLATNVGLGLLLHGKGLTFKDYSTEEVKSILTRAKVRSDAGIGIDADVHPQFVIDAFKAAGAPLDTSLLGKDVGPGKKGSKELGSYNEAEQNVRNMLKPLSPEEKAVYESAKKKTEELESSGAFAGKGVEFGGARQASVPKMFGKAEPVTTATVRPKGEKPTDTEPQSPNPDVPPNLPGGLPVEVKTAASDAEIEANLEHPDLNRVLTLRDIANGAKVSTMFEGQLNAVGLTHKGDKVVPITGKDAPSPAVQIDGKGNPIILQHAIDELRATFPATAEFVTMDEKQAREKFAQNGNADTSPIELPVENAAPPTAEVAPEPRVEPTPSGEVAAKPVVPNPAAVAKGADIAATLGKQSATKIQEKLSPLHPKVTKVIDGMISAYGQRGVSIVKETTDAPSGIEFDPDSKKIILDLPKIQANTEGSTPDDTIAWVRDSVARHELVHLVSTTDKAVEQHLDNLWSQLSDEDKSASAKTYYKGARSKWDSDFRGKHEFLVQLVQAAEDGKLEPALLKILKGNSKSLFDTLRQLMDALIARLQRILTDPKHKAHEAAKKTLEAFKAARARLFAEPVGKVDTTSGLTDKGETEGDLTTGLARKTTNPAEGGQSKSGIGNRPAASNEAPDASSFASGVASKVADSGDVATVDVKAHEAAASPHNDLTPPTPAQIEADNYKVGKVRLAGEDISIETPAGAKRREEWPALKDHYGRILGTKGADGELLDIFIKEGTPLDWNGPVFVVNQNKPDGTFDETKAIAGAKSVAEAREIYKRNYSKGWKGLGGIVKYDSLKDWVESDHSGKAKAPSKEEESSFMRDRNATIKASKEAGNVHLDAEPRYVENSRGREIYNVHDPKERGVIRTVSNRGEVVVHWNDEYSGEKNLATKKTEKRGKKNVDVRESWLMPTDLVDYAFVSKTTPSNKGVDVKPVNVKDGGMEIIPPPPIPQPTAEVVQPPAPPIPDLPSPYLASLVAKDAAHKILSDHVKQIFGEGAGARADGSKLNASEQEALNGIKKHAASQGWKWSDVQEVARKQNGLNSDFMEDNSHEARMLKSYRDTLAKAKDQATKSDALNAEAQAEIDAKNAEAKRLADEKAEAERKTREDERAAETERNLKFHDESVAKLPPVFVEKWKQDMSKKDRKALLNAIMLKTDNRNEPELVAALDRAPLPPAPPKLTEEETNAAAKERRIAREGEKLTELRPKLEVLANDEGTLWTLRNGEQLKKPGFNAIWTDEEKAKVKEDFKNAGLSVFTPHGLTNTLALDSESARILQTVLNERDAAVREKSKSEAVSKKEAADAATLAAADQNALSWARETFGEDFANAYNAAGFADFLSGKVKKYEAMRVNRKWLDGLEKLDAINKETGVVDFAKIKAAYENSKIPPAPPQLVAETLRASRDTLFDLPPRKRSLSGMRDAVSKRLDELERQEKEGNYPSDKSRGKKADDYEIRETGGMFVIHDKETGDDLGYTPYADRSKAEAKVKALNDAATLDNRTIVEGEDKLRERIDRLRTLLGKIEGAMAPAGTGGVISAATQYSQASEAILAENRAKAQAAMDKRLADRKADVAAAEADGWEVKRFEEKSSKRGGRPFTGWEVTHNGQRVKYGFSTKGEADERMVQLHKASVTRPKPTAEQNQTTREELKAKGATSVVKAAEPEKAPELMTPSDFAKTAEFVKAKGTNSGLMVRIGNVMQTFNEQTRGKLTKPAAEILKDIHKQIIESKFEMLRSDIADAHPQSVASTAGIARKRLSNPSVYSVSAPAVDAYGLKLPEGYVRNNDRYEYNPPTPATTPAEGQSTGGVVEGEKEGAKSPIPDEKEAARWDALTAEHTAKLNALEGDALDKVGSHEDVSIKRAGVSDAAFRDKILSRTHPDDLARALSTTPATPKETDKPPASSDVVKPPKLQSPSITPEQDAEYMKAAESGDLETAQRMVDEAAKKAGYDVGPVFHGSRPEFGEFFVFEPPYEANARLYAKEGAPKWMVEENDKLRAKGPMFWFATDEDSAAGYADGGDVRRFFLNGSIGEFEDRADAIASLQRGEFTLVQHPDTTATGRIGVTSIVARAANQIKSADPITRDASGRIIPLSERFNPSSNSILYSQSPDSDEYWSYNTLVKWMTDNGIPVDMTREEYEGEVARRKGIIEPPVHDTTQAGTAQMREQGGYEEYIKNEPRSFREKVWPEALQIVGKEPFKGTELVKELLDSPRALEDTERAILTHESLRRQKAYDKSIDDLIAAKPEDYAAAEKKMMAAREAHQEGLEALDMAGSKAGSALGAIRLMIKNDFSLGRLERRFRAALGPKPTPEEIKEADAKAAELAKVIKENDELTEQIRSQLDEIAGLKAAMKAHEHGLTPKPTKITKKAANDALERLKARRKLSSSDTLASPSTKDDDFNDLAIFGSSIIEDGASDLTSFTTAFNAAIPGALGDNASAVYEAAKVKFKEAEDAALKDSTPTGVTNKLKVKRAEIADLKADDLNRLALSIVQHEGVKDVDTLRSRMHELLKDAFPGVTAMQIGRVWSNVENATYPNPEEIHATVRDLRRQEAQIQKREIVLNEKRLPKKSGPQRDAPSDAERELARKLADAIKESGLQVTDPATQLATAQTRATTALKHRRDDLQKQVDAKKRESRANVTIPETPEMERLRGEIAALNKKLDILDPRNTGPTEAQKIKISENALKKSIENVDKEIAELKKEIFSERHGRVFATKPESLKTSAWSTTIAERRRELEQRQKSRDDLANQLDDLREAAKPVVDPLMKVLGKWEERQNLATVKAPPRTKSRLEELSKRYLDSESPRFVQDAVALGMSLGDAEDAKLILDAERNRREEIALASMRRRVRRNIERQVARAQAFDEDSPLARKTPAEKKLDKDLTEAEFQLSLAKREALRAEEKFRLRNRTLLRKAADSAVKWRRALILADYVVLYKLGMAAGWRMAFTPTEEAIGTAISKALPGLSKNAPREFGGSVRAEAEALTQGFRYLVENFGKVLKHGVSSMDTKYSSKPDFNDLDPSLSDYIGNSHAAIKLLPKASEFYRSFRKRTEAALRNGIDATSPAAVQAIGAAAYLDAQRAIFMNPNFVSEGWRAIIGKLRKTETSPNWAKVTADVMEAAIPIVKVPTNILFEALGSYIGGILRETPFALKSAAKAATTFDGQGFAKRFNDEYSKLPPEQAEAVLRHLKKGAFGNALMLLVMLTGATASKLIGGLWTPDDKREPWQVKPERLRLTEDSKDLPRWIAHNPVFDTLHFAVTAYQYAEKAANASKAIAAKAEVEIAEAEHRMKKSNADAKDFIKAKRERDVAQKKLEAARAGGDPNKLAWAMATLSGMTTSTLALVEKAPLIGNVGQFLDAIPEDKKGDYLKKELAASVIPTGVTNIAKGEDEGPDGEPIKRKMESFSDHLKNRIPGLRQTLPFKNGETDEFGFKRSETHVPIPGEKAIENFNKKNPDVKYHIPKISQASLDDLRNEVAKTAFQIRAGELLRKYSKEGIVKSEVVNDGSREEPNFVIKKTVEIPPITKEESENPTLKTIEKLKSMHRKAVTTAKSDAERPDWPLSYLDKYRSSVTK